MKDCFQVRIAEAKRRANGHWTGLLEAIGVDPKLLSRKGQPCPECGGTDRFAYSDKYGEGDSYCRACGHRDGFALAQIVLGCTFSQVLERVESQLGAVAAMPEGPARPATRSMKVLIERLLKESRPVTHGDEVDQYLRNRGIVLDDFPPTLRFHPELGYYERATGQGRAKLVGTCPAILALVHSPDGKLVTLHRTYIRNGRKAFGGESKKLLSSGIQGAAVRLFAPSDTLALAEGIETALAVHLRTHHPVWAAINCQNLERIELPDHVQRVCIYADNDAHSEFDGQASAFSLARRLKKRPRNATAVDREVPLDGQPAARCPLPAVWPRSFGKSAHFECRIAAWRLISVNGRSGARSRMNSLWACIWSPTSLSKDTMSTSPVRHLKLTLVTLLSTGLLALPAQAIDVDAAKALHKKNDCAKCHATDKDKKGPSLKKIADKYRGKADGEEKAIKNMTSGAKVKLDDGTEEEHKIIKTKDPAELKNLAQWILSH